MYVNMCVCMGARWQHCAFLFHALLYFLRQGLLLNLELTDLASQWTPVGLHRYFPGKQIKGTFCYAWILIWILGTELRSSCFSVRHFSKMVISSAQISVFIHSRNRTRRKGKVARKHNLHCTWSRYNITCSGNEAKIKSILLFINILLQKQRILPVNV